MIRTGQWWVGIGWSVGISSFVQVHLCGCDSWDKEALRFQPRPGAEARVGERVRRSHSQRQRCQPVLNGTAVPQAQCQLSCSKDTGGLEEDQQKGYDKGGAGCHLTLGREDFGERGELPLHICEASASTADRAVSAGCFRFRGSPSLLFLPESPQPPPSTGSPAARGAVSLGLGPWGSRPDGFMGGGLGKGAGASSGPKMGAVIVLPDVISVEPLVGHSCYFILFSNPP